MKTLIAYVTLSLAAAIGSTACAHQQLTNTHVAEAAATAAVIAGLVILSAHTCDARCDGAMTTTGPQPAALPPR